MKKQISILLFLFFGTSVFAQKTQNLSLTPPMGWNSWNKFACNISEKIVMVAADAMVSTGMNKVGYEYIVIDDCWQVARRADGTIVVDSTLFPSGMKALADYVHSKGLKFGIYSCAGKLTCEKRPGGNGYEVIDANTYASWGVDYLKYDWCYTDGIEPIKAYTDMSKALANSGRPIVFSLCEWGSSRPYKWAQNVGHLWRTTADIVNCYDCKTSWGGMGWALILDKQEGLEKFAGPGHWNDPDMLEVGNGKMTYNEEEAHFSFWCLLAAPLITGNDLRKMDEKTKSILLNKYAIEVNQDKLGIQGSKIYDEGDFEVWSKKMSNNRTAVIFFNRNDKEFTFEIDWKELGIKQNRQLFDVWNGINSGTVKSTKTLKIQGHSVKFFILK
ncbi:MAG: alpha-galactosidase [Porphyromonadaceae bacterium CG2_30_38_12]|nr:MAG: alpha-galactosidase [Porphyromonadaceae bacterium CG2_30_38_12]